MSSLNEVIAEMKRNNLIAEAKRVIKVIAEEQTYYQWVIGPLERDKDFKDFPGGIDDFFRSDEDTQFSFLYKQSWDVNDREKLFFSKPADKGKYRVFEMKRNNKLYYMIINNDIYSASLLRIVPESDYEMLGIEWSEEDNRYYSEEEKRI